MTGISGMAAWARARSSVPVISDEVPHGLVQLPYSLRKHLNVRITQTFQRAVDRAHPGGSLSIAREFRIYPSELLPDRAR
jgi:hypothetical protein